MIYAVESVLYLVTGLVTAYLLVWLLRLGVDWARDRR